MERLKRLLSERTHDLRKWYRGYIPNHYKRLTIPMERAIELAIYGEKRISSNFQGDILFFTQSLIAGAILSREFDTIVICTPSQYGKSWTLGRVGIVKAADGYNTYIAAATKDKTSIIMGHMFQAAQNAIKPLQDRIAGVDISDIQRLGKTLSKQKVSIVDGGFLEAITLGDTLTDKTKSGAIGRGDDYMVDEAGLVSKEAFAEIGRRDFAGIDGEKKQLVLISNPHKPGYFMDHLTEENPDERTLIIWADALTAVEEGEFTEEQTLNSDFAKTSSERSRYLLCELEETAMSMFDKPVVDNTEHEGIHFLGVDSAYKGKDNITLCHAILSGGYIHVAEVVTLDKKNWDDEHTPKEIIYSIARVARTYQVPLTCVDSGYGVWLIVGLRELGIDVKGINFGEGPTPERLASKTSRGHYAATNAKNKRAEMHLDLQDLIETKHITFSQQAYDSIKNVIPHISMKRTEGSKKIKIRSKSEIKNEIGHSPDEFDSVLLAVHAAILYNAEN